MSAVGRRQRGPARISAFRSVARGISSPFTEAESDRKPRAAEVARRGSKRFPRARAVAGDGGVGGGGGGRLSVARRSLNGAGVETRTGCRASRCRCGPLRLSRTSVSAARGPTREARRRRP